MSTLLLQPRPVFGPFIEGRQEQRLFAVERTGLTILSVNARRGKLPVLEQRVRDCLGMCLLLKPRRVAVGSTSALGVGPGKWLVMFEADNERLNRLNLAAEGCASVVDLSDAFGIMRLSGSALRLTLAKLVPLDLHPAAFEVGDVANTVAAHLRVILWRLEDDASGQPVFDIAVHRSLADSLAHELQLHTRLPQSAGL